MTTPVSRILPLHRVQLRFPSGDEARAAASMADLMLKALGAHADVYVGAKGIEVTMANPLEGAPHDIALDFIATSPRNSAAPQTMRLPPGMEKVALLEDDAPALNELAQPAPGVSHVMLDLETLGTRSGCPILSIGAVTMAPSGLGAEFHVVLERVTQVDRGLMPDPATITWWERQSAEAKAGSYSAVGTDARDSLRNFSSWLAALGPSKELRMWGNGADFDNVILAEVYRVMGLPLPWRFYNNRCYRLLKNLRKSIKLERAGTHHNALDDAKSQALHAIALLNDLNAWSDA